MSVNGVEKKVLSTMFPDNWTPQKIIDEVQHVSENQLPSTFKDPNRIKGEASNGMKIEMRMKNGKVESAYPVYSEGE